MNPQKQLIIIIALAAGLTSFLAGYILTQSGSHMGADNVLAQQRGEILDRFNGVTPSPTAKPVPAGVFQLSTTAVLAPAADPVDDSVKYFQTSGQVSSVNPATRDTVSVSTTGLPHLADIVWSTDSRQTIEEYTGRTGTSYKYYNFDTKEIAPLGSDITAAAFSPDGSKAVFARSNGSETDISIAQPDGNGAGDILKTKFDRVSLAWPADNTISILADTENGQTLYQSDEQGNITDLLDSENPMTVNWSPDASRILYSVASASQPELFLYSVSDKSTIPLNFQANANQCAWTHDGAAIICAGQQNHAGAIVSIDPADGSLKTLFPGLILNPSKVLLTAREDFLIMINGTDSTLYAYKLAQ